MNKEQSRRWLYLGMGSAALLFAGVLYAWSILKVPLREEFGWSAAALSLNFTLTMCFFCLGGLLGGSLIRRIGFSGSCMLSALLSAAGFLLAGSLKGRLGMLYLSYGVLGGLGIGIAYNGIIATVSGWFPDQKGLCSGVLMMGFGASSLVLGSMADQLIKTAGFGWRGTYRLLGIALGAVLCLAALVLKQKPPSGDMPQAEEEGSAPGEMLRSGSFWKAFLCVVFMAAVGNSVISVAKEFALSTGTKESVSTLLVGLLAVCNGFGRILTGALFDRVGRRPTMLAANGLTLLAAGICLASVLLASPGLCVLGLCLTGFSYGTCPTISSAYIAEAFGMRHFSQNFSIMNCNLIPAAALASVCSMLTAATGGYSGMFLLLVILSAAALVLNVRLSAHHAPEM